MDESKIENVIGAVSLLIADDIAQATAGQTTESAPAAAIALVGHLPGMGINHLSKAMGLSHPAAVRLVDRLERDRLLIRGKSATDKRAVTLTLTAKGARICRNIHRVRHAALARGLAGLSSAERQSFARIATRILSHRVADERHAIKICRLCDVETCPDCPIEQALQDPEAAVDR